MPAWQYPQGLQSTVTDLVGADNSNNTQATTNVAANEDGSVLERLEQIQEAINKGSGTALAANKSVVDALGTDGSTVTDSAVSVLGAIGANSANNSYNSATVASNADGSVLERLEYLQAMLVARLPQLVTKAVTFTAAAYEVSTAVAVFTVTGNVMVRAAGVVSTAIEADTGNDGTISLGVEDNVAILAPVVTCNETNFAIGDVWGTATTTKEADVFLNTGNWVVIGNGEDIEINVLTEDITAGVIDLYCEWIPLSAGATVVAV